MPKLSYNQSRHSDRNRLGFHTFRLMYYTCAFHLYTRLYLDMIQWRADWNHHHIHNYKNHHCQRILSELGTKLFLDYGFYNYCYLQVTNFFSTLCKTWSLDYTHLYLHIVGHAQYIHYCMYIYKSHLYLYMLSFQYTGHSRIHLYRHNWPHYQYNHRYMNMWILVQCQYMLHVCDSYPALTNTRQLARTEILGRIFNRSQYNKVRFNKFD